MKRPDAAGLIISGLSPDKNFVEIVELADHPWFLGCQFHPEFKSKPLAPHPLFARFIRASVEHRQERQGQAHRRVSRWNARLRVRRTPRFRSPSD